MALKDQMKMTTVREGGWLYVAVIPLCAMAVLMGIYFLIVGW